MILSEFYSTFVVCCNNPEERRKISGIGEKETERTISREKSMNRKNSQKIVYRRESTEKCKDQLLQEKTRKSIWLQMQVDCWI